MLIEEMSPREIMLALVDKLGTQVAVSVELHVTQPAVSKWLNDPDAGMGGPARELARLILARS